MAHNNTHRRSLASLDSKPSMDPTHKKYPTSTTTSTTKPHPTHHQQDPTLQTISNHFSKLYTNHKILTSSKGSNGAHPQPHPHPHPHPCVDTHLQAKPMTVSLNLDTSSTTLTKSKSQHARHLLTHPQKETTKTKVKEKVVKEAIHVHDIEKPSFVKPKTYEIKKPSSKKECKNKDFQEPKLDMKKASAFMSASYEGDGMKRPSFSLAMNGGGGRRRSFCSSQTELADFFSCSGVKVVSVDMPPFMQIHAVDCARKAYDSLEKFTAKTLAHTLKKEFDGVYGPAWHCIVGTSFGSFVTHSVGGFMYFSMDHKIYVLLFKTTVQKAE